MSWEQLEWIAHPYDPARPNLPGTIGWKATCHGQQYGDWIEWWGRNPDVESIDRACRMLNEQQGMTDARVHNPRRYADENHR